MERTRRAEKLIASLRWLVVIPGLLTVADTMPRLLMIAAAGFVAIYNAALLYSLADPDRFTRLGKRMATVCRGLDIAVVTLAVACAGGPTSLAYLLYWFVLIGFGFAGSHLRKLLAAGSIALAADAVATAAGCGRGVSPWVLISAIGVQKRR